MKKWKILMFAFLMVFMLAFAPAMAETAEAAAEAEVSWMQEAFSSLVGMKWYTALILVVMAGMGFVICRQKTGSWTAQRLSYAAMCIAIAFVLSCIKLFRMPQGGSVTPAAMLPLIMFALACGPAKGISVGCAFGMLQLIEDFYVVHPVQVLVDYPVAYAALSLGCLALLLPVSDRIRLPIAVLLGYFGRYAMACISGAVFFAEYAGEQNAWIYSLGYNISYLGVEALIACALSCVPGFSRILAMMRKRV